MKKTLFTQKAIVAIAFFLLCCSPDSQEPLLEVNGHDISQDYFVDLYRYNPLLTDVKDDSLAKIMILHGLICRQVITHDAAKQRFDESELLAARVAQHEREALIEEVWEQEIFPQVQISPEEISAVIERFKFQRILRYMVFEDEAAARDFKQNPLWRNFSVRADTVKYDPGSALSDSLFGAVPGEIGGPQRVNDLYYIYQVIAETNAPTGQTPGISQVEKKLKLKKSKNLFRKFAREKLGQYSYELDKGALKSLFEEVYNRGPRMLRGAAMPEIAPAAGEASIVRFANGVVWDGSAVLKRMKVSPYPLNFESGAAFQRSFLRVLKDMLDDQTIVFYAREKGYGSAEQVLRQKKLWSDFYLEQSWLERTDNPQNALDSLLEQSSVRLNYAQWDTLDSQRTNMAVLKQHFPKRTLVPPLRPVLKKQLLQEIESGK